MSAHTDLRLRELTPAGHGAVSVVELRGAGARARIGAWMRREAPAPGRARLADLHLGEEWLDEALVVALGPEHFELHLHGSPAVLARLAEELPEALIRDGDGPWDEAEVWASDAARRLADVMGDHAARSLLDQVDGALARTLGRLERAAPARAARGWRALAERTRAAAALFELPRVVLAGEPNVGKSTLFNALVGEQRALVADERGTTRDALELLGGHAGFAWRWIDTAGQGRGEPGAGALDELDRAGRERARLRLTQADLVLWCERADAPPQPPPVDLAPNATWLRVRTQADRLPSGGAPDPEAVWISALRDPLSARERVGEAVVAALGLAPWRWRRGRALGWTPSMAEDFEARSRRASP